MVQRFLEDMIDWYADGSFTDLNHLIRTVAHENETITPKTARQVLNQIINMGYNLVDFDFEPINDANTIRRNDDYFCIVTENF